MDEAAQAQAQAERFRADFASLRGAVARVIVGMEGIVDGTLAALFAGGHVLLEGVPGLGKTLLVRTLAQALHLEFSRIQFTPDLMPADITGTNILYESDSGGRQFRFEPGPVFANIVLADEINRATPKTQSALLEAMQEHSVTVAGTGRRLEEPFLVLATQNPIEMEGTYPLPEAQLDRFLFKLLVPFPSLEQLGVIMDRTTSASEPTVEPVLTGARVLEMMRLVRSVPIAPHVQELAMRVVLATHPDQESAPESVRRYVRYGASPRAGQALVLGGKVQALLDRRYNVAVADLRAVAAAALRHRLVLNFEGEADAVAPDLLVADALKTAAVAHPALEV
ncbi:MAG TPA: AAA family ATPase [Armatimonadota bacterium]|nr:AAA family ATPase [Armatimonadota bacterium]